MEVHSTIASFAAHGTYHCICWPKVATMNVLLRRSPQYNSVRLGFTMIIALCFGAFYWGVSLVSS
jgi:hypothetical protein